MHKVIHLVLADIFSLLTLHITKVSKGNKYTYKT